VRSASSRSAPDGAAATRTRRGALVLVALLAAAQVAALTRGSFRADDWINLERGALATSAAWREVWTGLNPFTLYRPLVDVWHGTMLRLFGLEAPPMMAVLVALLLLQSWMLARLVRARGGSHAAAALAMAAVWAQPNATTWTTLWVSNATGSLMTTCTLAALLLHHRAVRVAARGGNPAASIAGALVALVAGALCKEEMVLLVPALAALEAARWPRLAPRERRAAVASWAAIAVIGAAYAVFRTQVMPTPQTGATRYTLALGTHTLRNAAFFAAHLAALPATALVLARVFFPGAFAREARRGESWARAREGMLAGVAWSAIALALYLPIQGRPAYGYLYAPAFGVAFAVAHGLAWAGSTATAARRTAAWPLAAHAGLALALTAAGLAGVGWPRYRAIAAEAFATFDRELPSPPPRARLVFLDPGAAETVSGRSLFNLVFSAAAVHALRLHTGRADLEGVTLHGPAAAAARASGQPPADAAFVAERGRIVRIAWPAPPDRAERTAASASR
jgi:hypothetical protein